MKKLLVMALMAVLCTATGAFATNILTNYSSVPTGVTGVVGTALNGTAGTLTIGSTPFSTSTNVNLVATGNNGGYNCSSKHLSGDKQYMSSSVSASIEEASATKGTPMSALVLSTTTANVYTGTAGY